jgi:hypothetical protein
MSDLPSSPTPQPIASASNSPSPTKRVLKFPPVYLHEMANLMASVRAAATEAQVQNRDVTYARALLVRSNDHMNQSNLISTTQGEEIKRSTYSQHKASWDALVKNHSSDVIDRGVTNRKIKWNTVVQMLKKGDPIFW